MTRYDMPPIEPKDEKELARFLRTTIDRMNQNQQELLKELEDLEKQLQKEK